MTDFTTPTPLADLTRRRFLGTTAAAFGGIAVAGWGTAPARLRALAGATPRSSAANVGGFVRLSQIVTGVEDLPRDHAATYMQALESAGLKLPPSRLVELGGFADDHGPSSLAEFQRSALYRKPGARACAEAVAAAWWSGMVPTAHGEKVITFADALAWRAQPWAEPPTDCLGATGAWAKRGRMA
jgi:D-sorbitol dehydrogenase-like protein